MKQHIQRILSAHYLQFSCLKHYGQGRTFYWHLERGRMFRIECFKCLKQIWTEENENIWRVKTSDFLSQLLASAVFKHTNNIEPTRIKSEHRWNWVWEYKSYLCSQTQTYLLRLTVYRGKSFRKTCNMPLRTCWLRQWWGKMEKK